MKKLIDYGIKIGTYNQGTNNNICDVYGINVGHHTYSDGDVNTGVTVIVPKDNIFREKLVCASYVINGYGKSTGLIQIEEMGTLESIIALTNTLSVGPVIDGVVDYMLTKNSDIGLSTGTVNPIVLECNDMRINNIRRRVIKNDDVIKALNNCSTNFEEGSVGAGTGMMCFGLKGGIGSSSRIVEIENNEFTVGSLVLSNFGSLEQLRVLSKEVGKEILNDIKQKQYEDKGSIIIIIATDIPMSYRQLKRLCKRVPVSLGRLGSTISNGSGDVVLAFSTTNITNHYEKNAVIERKELNENHINKVFNATIDSVEESILNSMLTSKKCKTLKGETVHSLKDYTRYFN